MRPPITLSAMILACLCSAQQVDPSMLAGLTALKKEDPGTAERAFDRVVEEEPANAKAWYYRAVSKLVQGDNEGALQDLDHLLIIDPGNVHALLRRAEVRRITGARGSARNDLYSVLGSRPTGPAAEHALFELGRMAMEDGDLPNALVHYDRLVEIADHNALAWCDRGIVLSEIRDDDRALADLEKALELDPSLEQAYAHMAIVLFRQDRRQEGCHALQQAHALGERSVEELMLLHCDR